MVEFKVYSGTVYRAIDEMIAYAQKINDTVFCIFNGARIEVNGDSDRTVI